MEKGVSYLGLMLFNGLVVWVFQEVLIMLVALIITHFFYFVMRHQGLPSEEFRRHLRIAKEEDVLEGLKMQGKGGVQFPGISHN